MVRVARAEVERVAVKAGLVAVGPMAGVAWVEATEEDGTVVESLAAAVQGAVASAVGAMAAVVKEQE